jgi:hypothetical protein
MGIPDEPSGARRRHRLLPAEVAGGRPPVRLAGPPRLVDRRSGGVRCGRGPARASPVGRTRCRRSPPATWSPPRVASGACFNALAEVVPGLLGGGADLTGNTGTELKGATIQAFDTPVAARSTSGCESTPWPGS